MSVQRGNEVQILHEELWADHAQESRVIRLKPLHIFEHNHRNQVNYEAHSATLGMSNKFASSLKAFFFDHDCFVSQLASRNYCGLPLIKLYFKLRANF